MSWVESLAELDGLRDQVRGLKAENQRLESMCVTQSLELQNMRAKLNQAMAERDSWRARSGR